MLETDVLIVGGGPAGLTSSLLLSSYGTDTLLVSKYLHPSPAPKAHLLSLKTMEIYRELGIEAAIRAIATPPENALYVGWYAGLAGPNADYGREIARLGAWGRGHQDRDWRGASAVGYANLSQSRLEPLLKMRAEERAPGTIRFNHQFIAMQQVQGGVVATIEDRATSEQYQVRCRYLLGCDGGRTISSQLGIEMQGHLAVATNISIHFSADLSQWARDTEVLNRIILNPDFGTPCVLLPVGPDEWGPKSREWVLHLMSFPGEYKRYGEQEALQQARGVLGLPDLNPAIHAVNCWPLDAVVASRFRVGRTFLMGDAAHRMPPSGGHGLNAGVQDAYNLCWKMAAVLAGKAGDALLDTYEVERRPVAERTVASAFANWNNSRQFTAAIGFAPNRSAEEIWRDLRTMWDGQGPEAEAARQRAREALTVNLTAYNHLNISFGYRYDTGAIIADGKPTLESLDPIQIYEPSTSPGSSVPHATLEDMHGASAIGDLLGRGSWVLLAGENGVEWCIAARALAAQRGITLEATTIGATSGGRLDMRREWLRRREFGPSGAVLVRPDRFIAWRALEIVDDPAVTLSAVFDKLLGFDAGPQVPSPKPQGLSKPNRGHESHAAALHLEPTHLLPQFHARIEPKGAP